MQSNESFKLSDDLNDFAKQLMSFEARSLIVNRDEMLFQAGRAAARAEFEIELSSSRKVLRVWQAAASVLLSFSVGLGTSIAISSGRPVEAVVADRNRVMIAPGMQAEDAAAAVSEDQLTTVVSSQDHKEQGRGRSAKETTVVVNRDAIEGLQARLALIERLIEGGTLAENSATSPAERVEDAPRNHSGFALSYRSLLRGDGTHSRIHRLIEEPNL